MTLVGNSKWAFAALAVAALTWLAPVQRAEAQSWPNRPVRFIITLGPGSGVDLGARLFADKLSAKWGQPVVVENRPGGDGMVAITSFLGAHDDHTLLVAPVASFTAHPYFHDKLPYDPNEMIPVARISKTVLAVSVPASLGVNSMKELEALARAKPGQLNWTTATGFTDFVFAGFLHTVGLKMAKVPYKNPAGAASDLVAGTIQVYMPAYAIVRPQVEAGKVKALAVTNHERVPMLPEVPTVQEAGYPSLNFDGLVGLFSTRELSEDARGKIAADIAAVAGDPDIVKKMNATAQIVAPGNGKEFAESIAQQKAQVAAVAKLFGNKPVQ
ncbi:MAG: tripartite tricarboxylate transporter substrate binding protein [Rhizobiales bacterium]|nr:tripartite tricarboxylate transporter substrate binding protein [Hyphomicrobiales bacterium]